MVQLSAEKRRQVDTTSLEECEESLIKKAMIGEKQEV
jgi:hypothetical protein